MPRHWQGNAVMMKEFVEMAMKDVLRKMRNAGKKKENVWTQIKSVSSSRIVVKQKNVNRQGLTLLFGKIFFELFPNFDTIKDIYDHTIITNKIR